MHRHPALRPRPLLLLAALIALAALGVASLGAAEVAAPPPARYWAAPPPTPAAPPSPATGPVLSQPTPSNAAVGPYSAHEWGVWRIENGAVTHLDDLRRESPPFVAQVGGPRIPSPPPRIRPSYPPGGAVAFKPVIFFYADQSMAIDLTVRFPGGQPWLSFPAPSQSELGPPDGLIRYVGQLEPSYDPGGFPPVDPNHFWTALRGVGATPFIPAGSSLGESERFVFYDGPVRFSSPLNIDPRGRIRSVGSSAPAQMPVWLVSGGQFEQHVAGAGVQLLGTSGPRRWSPIGELDGRLELALRAAGLTGAEARALLTTWSGDLHESRVHAIYLLPRADFDRMLPITLSPRPRELVRVGLVIHRL